MDPNLAEYRNGNPASRALESIHKTFLPLIFLYIEIYIDLSK